MSKIAGLRPATSGNTANKPLNDRPETAFGLLLDGLGTPSPGRDPLLPGATAPLSPALPPSEGQGSPAHALLPGFPGADLRFPIAPAGDAGRMAPQEAAPAAQPITLPATVSSMPVGELEKTAQAIVEAVLYPVSGDATGFLSEWAVAAGRAPESMAAGGMPQGGKSGPTAPAPTITGPAAPADSLQTQPAGRSPGFAGLRATASGPAEHGQEKKDAPDEQAPAAAAPAAFQERVLHCFEDGGHCQVWLRDYRLSETEERSLVERVLKALQAKGKPIHRITLNGRLAWSAPTHIALDQGR